MLYNVLNESIKDLRYPKVIVLQSQAYAIFQVLSCAPADAQLADATQRDHRNPIGRMGTHETHAVLAA